MSASACVIVAALAAAVLGLLGAKVAADVGRPPVGVACLGLAALAAFVAFWEPEP